jgi:phosphoglycerate dehydrogenase-like enzyme
MSSGRIDSVLVLHDSPDEIRPRLERDCPGTRLHLAKSGEEALSALTLHNPDAVFSVQHRTFSGAYLRSIMSYRSVRWFHAGGSGVDYLLPWPRTDLRVSSGAGVLAAYLAETVIAGILALNSNVLIYREQMRNREWRRHPFRSLSGQTILVVGLGAIGGAVARLAKGFGMHVIAVKNDVSTADPAADEVFPPEALSELVPRADVISLHIRLTPQTRHTFDRTLLARMNPSAVLINTSRGAIVDEEALADALECGAIAGAYLDVFEREPLDASSRLWNIPTVLVTPHVSDYVADWALRYTDRFTENLARWNEGRPLLNEIALPIQTS